MTPFPWTDLVIIAGLIVLNGVFAMSELAIVSARTGTLQTRAQKGNGAAQTAPPTTARSRERRKIFFRECFILSMV